MTANARVGAAAPYVIEQSGHTVQRLLGRHLWVDGYPTGLLPTVTADELQAVIAYHQKQAAAARVVLDCVEVGVDLTALAVSSTWAERPAADEPAPAGDGSVVLLCEGQR